MFISESNINIHRVLVNSYRMYEIVLNLICLLTYFNINDRNKNIIANMWLLHFLKRIYEVVKIHKYNKRLCDYHSLFIYCAKFFYFIIHSILITNEIDSKFDFNWVNKCLVFIWGWAEMQNHICHLHLSSLHNEFDSDKEIPYGSWFNKYTAPNYTFELLSWLCFTLVSGSLTSMFFTVSLGYILYLYAVDKKIYYKSLNSKYDNRLLF